MDPIATLRIINDDAEDMDTRSAHIHYLAEWIARGGFVPTTGEHIRSDVPWEQPDYELAAAVNVAIVNSDLSGLEGMGYRVVR